MFPSPSTLDTRIACLTESIPHELRVELQNSLATLREARNIPGAIVTAARLMEGRNGLLGQIAIAAEHDLQSSNLADQIESLAKNGVLPTERASDLHWVRIRSNLARHRSEQVNLAQEDAEMAISLVLGVVEWFLCVCPLGLRLPTIYSQITASSLSLLSWFREYFCALVPLAREVALEVNNAFAMVASEFPPRDSFQHKIRNNARTRIDQLMKSAECSAELTDKVLESFDRGQGSPLISPQEQQDALDWVHEASDITIRLAGELWRLRTRGVTLNWIFSFLRRTSIEFLGQGLRITSCLNSCQVLDFVKVPGLPFFREKLRYSLQGGDSWPCRHTL